MGTYILSVSNKEKENKTVKQIVYNNKYDTSSLNKFNTIDNKIKLNTPKTKVPNSRISVKKQNSSLDSSKILPLKLLSRNKTL
jgi:hypothetical protein